MIGNAARRVFSTAQCGRYWFGYLSTMLFLSFALVVPNMVLLVVAWSRQGLHSITLPWVYIVLIGLPIVMLAAAILLSELPLGESAFLAFSLGFLIAEVNSRPGLILICLYACYLSARFLARTHRQVIFYGTLAVVVVVAMASIIAYFGSWGQFFTPDFGKRACWPYVSPNILYPICLIGFCSCLGLSISGGQTRSFRSIALAGALINGIALVLTFSRAGWVGAAVAVVCICSKLAYKMRIAAFLGVLFIVVGVATVRSHGAITHVSNDRSIAGRVFIWKCAISDLSRNPWIGGGYGSFEKSTAHSKSIERSGSAPREPKNLYLSLCYDYGFVGIGMFAVAVICMLTTALWLKRQQVCSVADRSIATAVWLSVISLLTAGCFDTPICGDLMRINVTIIILALAAMLNGAANDCVNRYGENSNRCKEREFR